MSSPVLAERLRWRSVAARTRRPPAPRVGVDADTSVPAWVLRLASAAAATGCSAVLATSTVTWVIAATLAIAILLSPSGPGPALFAVGTGALLLASPGDPFSPRAFLLILGVHLAVQLAAFAGAVSWRARVELRLLTGAARTFFVVQAVAQMAAVAGAWMAGNEVAVGWIPLAAAVALGVLAWAVVLHLRTEDRR